ncbi:hypothetical protein [Vibrio gigantis]|uniref:Uncharacterized protein n=1 Tax=Vibrio gigantis TaxID=296199 RepID=A0A5M9NWU9_9VIBR|nr:hypothetical protein [Vibrio gigantis]KAA8675661.1 hypothetical protein F4W18_13645 [Vibrio gigantis]
MTSFIKKPFIRELIGSLILTVVITGTAPTISNQLEATEYVQKLFNVKTIGEYMDQTREQNTSELEYHVRASYEVFFRYTAPSTIFNKQAFSRYAELHASRA